MLFKLLLRYNCRDNFFNYRDKLVARFSLYNKIILRDKELFVVTIFKPQGLNFGHNNIFLCHEKLIVLTFKPLSRHCFSLTGLIICHETIFLNFDKQIVTTINSMLQQSIVTAYFLMLI